MKTLISTHSYCYRVLCIILLALIVSPINAQYSISEHILINEGMSNNFVQDIKLDKKGRLWVATESGLNAYNGISFDSYNISNSALNANMINCIWYDSYTDLVWVGTKGSGICSVNPDSGEITNYNTPDSTLNNISDITPANDHRLWVISPNHIMLLDPVTKQITPIDFKDVKLNYYCGADDGNGNLIIGTHMQGASVYNSHSHQLLQLITDPGKDQRINVNEIQKDRLGRIWIGTSVGLWFYQPGSTRLVPFDKIPRTEIFGIEEVGDHTLWVTDRNSIQIINLITEEVTPLQINGEIKLFDDIQALYEDPYGNIWIGGAGNGIEFINHTPPLFEKLYNVPFWGIYNDGETTWAGTRDRLLGFQGKRCVYDLDLAKYGKNYGIVLSISGDGEDLIYLAVSYHFLSYNKKTGEFKNITSADGKEIDAITFYRDELDTFWITTTDGIYTLQDGKAVECIPINKALNNLSAHGIRRDKQGKLWVATYENGIYVFDKDFQLLANYSQQTGFPSNSIQHLRFDLHDRLWMSTPDGPCCIPDTRYPNQYEKFGHAEGLSDTYIRAILEDRNGNIWMSTTNGISVLNYAERSFVNYSQSDYVPVNNLSGGAIIQQDGGLVFTSMEGLCLCYPDSINNYHDPVNVNLFSVQALDSDEHGPRQTIILPDDKGIYHLEPKQNSFRLYFGTTDYANSRYLEYECQTNDSKQGWSSCSRGVMTFRDLNPDTYNIKIRYRLKGQPWSEQNVFTTIITIHQPWWWTIWARIIYLLIAISTLFISIRLYLYRLKITNELELEKRKNIVEHEQNGERLQFFTNITHELKTPLTLIQAPLEELLHDGHLDENVKKRIQLVYESSCRLTDLCNKLLDFRKSETHNHILKVKKGDIGLLVQEVGDSFAELNSNPQLDIIVDVEKPTEEILFDADVIRSILTNLISNALKYTPKGSIKLQLKQNKENDSNLTIISVSDTGYGIPDKALPHIFDRYYQVRGPHQASGTGIGLAIVRSMAELHLAEIKVDSKEGEGSTFTLSLNNNETYPDAMHADVNAQPISTDPTETLADEKDTRPILLLVEDDNQILAFMSDALSNDYRILRAHNGQEGLDLALVHMPDVIITDLMMPVMNGNILCRTLKNDIRTSHIPVIMLTAKDTPEDQMEGFTDGADIYLTKPFSIMMLRARLQNILSARTHLMAWINAQGLQPQQTTPTSLNSITENEDEPVPVLSTYDQNFLRDVKAFIIEHIDTDNIRMEDIASSLHISHSTLYRKIKALTGLSGAEFIRKTRILHSAELLRNEHCNVSEAAYRCGFSNLAYFRASFKEVFGITPSEYQKQ